jgi:hypothetical protein
MPRQGKLRWPLALLALVASACAHGEGTRPAMRPSYWQCESACKWDFDFSADESGKIPIGVWWDGAEYVCQCGDPSA